MRLRQAFRFLRNGVPLLPIRNTYDRKKIYFSFLFLKTYRVSITECKKNRVKSYNFKCLNPSASRRCMVQSIHVFIILRGHEIHVSEMVSKCLRKLYYYRRWSNNTLFCALYLFCKCMQKIMEKDMTTSHLSSKRRRTIHQHVL